MARVYDYDTSSRLEGEPSAALIAASAAVPDGGVAAYRDAAGIWQHVPESERDHVRQHQHEAVRSVYVEPD